MKRTSFLVLVLEGLICLHRTGQLQLFWHQWLAHKLGLPWYEWFTLEINLDHSVIFGTAPTQCILGSFIAYEGCSISSKGFLPTVRDIMFIWIKFTHSCPFSSLRASLVAQLVKKSTCNVGNLGSIPGLGRSPGEGKGYPLQYSGLENSMDCKVYGVPKSQTWLNDFCFHFSLHPLIPQCWCSTLPPPTLPRSVNLYSWT